MLKSLGKGYFREQCGRLHQQIRQLVVQPGQVKELHPFGLRFMLCFDVRNVIQSLFSTENLSPTGQRALAPLLGPFAFHSLREEIR